MSSNDNKIIIQGGCHCGNIQYHYEVEPSLDGLSVRTCNCSFCTKQGAIYTSDPGGHLDVKIKLNNTVKKYQFSSKHIDFIFCGICGVMPLAVTEINTHKYALINIKTATTELHNLSAQIVDYSNESSDESVKRRKSKWISSVNGI